MIVIRAHCCGHLVRVISSDVSKALSVECSTSLTAKGCSLVEYMHGLIARLMLCVDYTKMFPELFLPRLPKSLACKSVKFVSQSVMITEKILRQLIPVIVTDLLPT